MNRAISRIKSGPGAGRDPCGKRGDGIAVGLGLRQELNDGTPWPRHLRNALYFFALLFVMLFVASGSAYAVRPDEMLANPRLEARAEAVGSELRCLVCRNQSIEVSEAGLAHDLRLLVRRRIAAGDTDAQVIAYIRSRYGDYVLLRPPFETRTLLLWAGPGLILLLGAFAIFRFYRRRGGTGPPPLSAEERRRLSQVLGEAPGP